MIIHCLILCDLNAKAIQKLISASANYSENATVTSVIIVSTVETILCLQE